LGLITVNSDRSNAWRLARQTRRLGFHSATANVWVELICIDFDRIGVENHEDATKPPLMAGADGRWIGGLMKRGLLEGFQVTAEENPTTVEKH
jgi:hypothetical protein